MVVGAPNATLGGNGNPGAAYVFTAPFAGWANMSQTARLTAVRWRGGRPVRPLGFDQRQHPRRRCAGATVAGNYGQGAAYVFTEPGSGWANMTQTAKLTASDGAAGDGFGYSVSMGGNSLAVGTYERSNGQTYVFTEPATGWADMPQTDEFTPSDGAAGDWLGSAVSISGNMVAVGSSSAMGSKGAACVFATSAAHRSTTVTAVSTTAAAHARYTIGGTIPITVAFSGPVLVSGTPHLTLDDGGAANYVSGSGTSTLTFSYVVGIKQDTADLDEASNGALLLSGGSILDMAGNAAVLTLPATGTDGLAAQNIVIDTGTPTVPAADWTAAGLTLTLGGGDVHVYTTGTTTDVVAPWPLATATDVVIAAPSNTTAKLTIDSTAGDPVPAGALNYSGAGGLIKAGSGIVIVSDPLTYTGGTAVSAGTLIATSAAAIPANTYLTIGGAGLSSSIRWPALRPTPGWRPCPATTGRDNRRASPASGASSGPVGPTPRAQGRCRPLPRRMTPCCKPGHRCLVCETLETCPFPHSPTYI